MDKYQLKWTSLQQALFSLLCARAGEKLSQRELAKLLRVSPTAIGNALKGLTGLVRVEKTKTINFVSLNRDEPKAIELKRVENLKNVYTAGLASYLEERLLGATIILFGSYARGEDGNRSDIDIAVIGRKEKDLHLEAYEKRLQRRIHPAFYPSWKDIQPQLKNNILNGIVLAGSVQL